MPIHDWELEKVWHWCGTSTSEWQRRRKLPDEDALLGWPAHPAYALGNERLSGQFCVLGSQNDLSNAKRYNPELYAELVALEQESGWAFQKGKPLADLA